MRDERIEMRGIEEFIPNMLIFYCKYCIILSFKFAFSRKLLCLMEL